MSSKIIKIKTPLDRTVISNLKACQMVTLTGEILVFRDQVHQIICGMIEKGEQLPFSLKDRALYYCGPTPARHGMPVGSSGPTTSSRMDMFTEPLLKKGLAMTIGKGNRSERVVNLLKQRQAVYMLAVGGAGAFLAHHVKAASVIAFPELGPEAAQVFIVEEMPLIVGIDSHGNNAFV